MESKQHKIIIIGSGFSSLSAAALLAKAGNEVVVLEKNDQLGGRARIWQKEGFRFDMGPSWYWMPDVFEDFFGLFGKKSSDFYDLKRLEPSYRIFFSDGQVDLPSKMVDLLALFESIETGAGSKLEQFLSLAKYKYDVGMKDYVFKLSNSVFEYADPLLMIQGIRLQLLKSMSSHVREYFSDPKLIQILEFPVLFLGSTPERIPAMYSMMNFADMSLGTWYPQGGMHQIVNAMVSLCEDFGVKFELNTEVLAIQIEGDRAVVASTTRGDFGADFFVAGSDYEYTDQVLLPLKSRNYTEKYWDNRTLSPSALLYFIGVNKRLTGLSHHNLFFDKNFQLHTEEIYTMPQWPSDPLFYACCPSITDPSVAPDGSENLFLLMPVAPGLEDHESTREKYFKIMISRLEQATCDKNLAASVVVKRSYSVSDFEADYHSYKGNAYGLANTLHQTAFLKPKMRAKKVNNFVFTGQLTVPGPGVPPSIISGRLAAREAERYLQK